tara:strand:- start:90 stop:332 length:243 start_codon:yes stop_codon:yes gene_type:complete
MTDQQLAEVLVEILNEGMFNDFYMRGDHNKNEVRRLMVQKGVSNEQVSDVQERYEIQSDVTFTEVLAYLIENLNPGAEIP